MPKPVYEKRKNEILFVSDVNILISFFINVLLLCNVGRELSKQS